MQEATREEPKINIVRTDRIKTTINILIPERYFPTMTRYKLGAVVA